MRRWVAGLVLALLLAGCGGDPGPRAVPPDRSPEAAARHFLDTYVESDGRVVRRDQGGDTVSEGQAYAMLLAVAIGDETRFDRAWAFAERELRGPGGLLAWRYAEGRVADAEPAADADLDAGRALLLAARRFGRPDLRADAARAARGLRTLYVDGRLVAGPWARAAVVLNPSYTAPRSLALLGLPGLDRALSDLHALGPLPPDWASAQSEPHATGPPSGDGVPQYGYDAARTPVRLAEACEPEARALAARWWPRLRDDAAALPRTLDGPPATGAAEHPVALVGAAAAAGAAGDADARDRLLDAAQDLDARRPSYYGAAWVALGRVMLQTELLGDGFCR